MLLFDSELKIENAKLRYEALALEGQYLSLEAELENVVSAFEPF